MRCCFDVDLFFMQLVSMCPLLKKKGTRKRMGSSFYPVESPNFLFSLGMFYTSLHHSSSLFSPLKAMMTNGRRKMEWF